jgi:hypothetical protein
VSCRIRKRIGVGSSTASREWEYNGIQRNETSLEFRNSKGTAVWPQEELEDFVCDVICAAIHRYEECVI